MMNQAHLHLALAHIPIVLVPTGLALLLIGMAINSLHLKRTSLWLFTAGATAAIPVFLLGEGAEEIVEHAKKASESLIEEHEEIADLALWISIALGGLSLLSLSIKRLYENSYAISTITILAILSSSALAIAGNKGGRISHPEAFEATSTDLNMENKDDD